MTPAPKREPITIVSGDCRTSFEAWDQICRSLSKHGRLCLFTDFDGTLADITAVPSAAAIDPRARAALKQLSEEGHVTIVVLSGRSVSDVADRVGLPLIYGGDHGLELHSPELNFVAPGAESARRALPAICNTIRERTSHIPGTLVEAKRFTASVHYRQVPSELVSELGGIVRKTVAPAPFSIRDGHCVFEIRPRLAWGKGEAVRWVLNRGHFTEEQAICIGDDETDEDMFTSVPQGVNVRVITTPNGADTAARYLINRSEVAGFLEEIVEIIQGVRSASSVDTRLPWHNSSVAWP